MCYAIPGKVKKVEGKTVFVDYFGEEKKAINELDGLASGDYIYAQGGYVIEKIQPDTAASILSVWKETFFELQEADLRLSKLDLESKVDAKLTATLDKTLAGIPLSKEDLFYLFNADGKEALNLISKTANFLRHKYFKNSCCVHGIIEISNYCFCECLYCGISKQAQAVSYYRMSPEEIVEAAKEAVNQHGFRALVLQSGEDNFYSLETLTEIIRKIKENLGVFICISFGEVGLKGLEMLYQAGARALLMRFETSNQAIYRALHPKRELSSRLKHLSEAHNLGYLIMTGSLIGLPGQSKEDIINDIYLAKELKAEMFSFGPFLPHPATKLAKFKASSKEDVLKTLSLARFIDPEGAKILITSAFETLTPDAPRQGLLSGANSLMLNVTPLKYRKNYTIYPDRAHSQEPVIEQIEKTISLLRSLGRAPTDLGVAG